VPFVLFKNIITINQKNMNNQQFQPNQKPNQTIWIIAVVIVLAVAAYGIWTAMSGSNANNNTNTNIAVNQNANLNTNTNSAANTNTSTNENDNINTNSSVIDTSDWKTYTNTKYNFSIKYPNSWGKISEMDGSVILNLNSDSIQKTNSLVLGMAGNTSDNIFIQIQEDNTVDRYVSDDSYDTISGTKKYKQNPTPYTSSSGVSGTRVELDSKVSGYSYAYVFQKSNSIIVIEIKQESNQGSEVVSSLRYTD